jgi:hypothetical protein
MQELLHNKVFVLCAMAVIVFALTQVLKLPIKFFTKKIKNETARKRVNATILLIPFALGILFEFLYGKYVTILPFNVINGLGYGFSGISLYSIVERFFGIKTQNPYDTKEGKAVTELISNISSDGKIDEKDHDAVKAFWDKVK